jgi:hypothetical protein
MAKSPDSTGPADWRSLFLALVQQYCCCWMLMTHDRRQSDELATKARSGRV